VNDPIQNYSWNHESASAIGKIPQTSGQPVARCLSTRDSTAQHRKTRTNSRALSGIQTLDLSILDSGTTEADISRKSVSIFEVTVSKVTGYWFDSGKGKNIYFSSTSTLTVGAYSVFYEAGDRGFTGGRRPKLTIPV
jgi:hypothetical protein